MLASGIDLEQTFCKIQMYPGFEVFDLVLHNSVTAQLVCASVGAYVENRISYNEAQCYSGSIRRAEVVETMALHFELRRRTETFTFEPSYLQLCFC